jgi:hypothetical protein
VTNSVDIWNQPSQLTRSTRRAVGTREQQWALDALDDRHRLLVIEERLRLGSEMTDYLNYRLDGLGEREANASTPQTARRMGHAIDGLTMAATGLIGDYMRDQR